MHSTLPSTSHGKSGLLSRAIGKAVRGSSPIGYRADHDAPVGQIPADRCAADSAVTIKAAKDWSDEEIIAEYHEMVKSISHRHSSHQFPQEDLYQEGIMAAIEAHRRFDESRGKSLKNWVRMMVVGDVIDAIRRLRSQYALEVQGVDLSDVNIDTAEVSFPPELRALAARALNALPDKLREVAFRNLINGESLESIAQEKGVTRARMHQVKEEAIADMRRELGLAE